MNGEFFKGETWVIEGTVSDHQLAPIDMTGGNVVLKIARSNNQIVITQTTASEGTINAEAGTYSFEISPSVQTSSNITPGTYRYEIRAFVADGRVTTQSNGEIRVLASLFS